MTGRPDLTAALRLVADAGRPEPDPVADLARAKTAARRRFRRRLQVASLAGALMVVTGLAMTGALDRSDKPSGPGRGPALTAVAPVHLVAETFAADPYTFDLTPKGWSVQGQTPQAVTITPDDGHTSKSPYVFIGKLVILFDKNPPGSKAFEYAGRRYWIHGDSGYTTISTRTLPGEPTGVVRVQYPASAGWTMTSMLRFLGSVHVGPGARPGLG